MRSYIFKQNDYLTEAELKQIEALFHACIQFDGVPPKIYWDSIAKKRDIAGNFLCYAHEQLIGYFSFFLFEQNAVYLSAMVHPSARRQGIFSHFLHAAMPSIKHLDVQYMLVPVAALQDAAIHCLQLMNAKKNYGEYRMERRLRTPEIITDLRLTLRQANSTDVATIARIDTACFHSDYQLVFEQFQQAIIHPKREIWLAYLGNECIGKAHIYFNQEGALLHEVGIMPAKQSQGLGTLLLQLLINQLLSHHQGLIYLEVMAANESALLLYKRCAFVVTATYDYWCVSL